MTHGITTVFICPRVETGEIVILNGFVLFSFIMEFYGIGATAKETVTAVLQIQSVDKLLQVGVFFQLVAKLVLPYDDQIVSELFEFSFSLFGHLEEFV